MDINEKVDLILKEILSYFDTKTWKEFTDSQELGECGTIVSVIGDFKLPGVVSVFGKIKIDAPYVDEDGEEYTVINHQWVTIDGEIFEFSKGSLQDFIVFEDLYAVDAENLETYITV